jgi:hypothetical protein
LTAIAIDEDTYSTAIAAH